MVTCGKWGWTIMSMCLSTVADGGNRPLWRNAIMNDLRTLDLLKYPFCLMIALWRRWRTSVSHKVVLDKETNCLPAINRMPSYSPSTVLVRWPIRHNKPYYSVAFFFSYFYYRYHKSLLIQAINSFAVFFHIDVFNNNYHHNNGFFRRIVVGLTKAVYDSHIKKALILLDFSKII